DRRCCSKAKWSAPATRRRRAEAAALPRDPRNEARHRLVRDSRRELYGRGRTATPLHGGGARPLSNLTPRRGALDRRRRAARKGTSGAAETSRSALRACAVFGTSRLVEPRQCLSQRSSAAAL